MELTDVEFSPLGPSDGWCGTLVVDGVVLGAVEAAPDDGDILVSLAPGASPDDARLADRIDLLRPGSGPDGLVARCTALALAEWARREIAVDDRDPAV